MGSNLGFLLVLLGLDACPLLSPYAVFALPLLALLVLLGLRLDVSKELGAKLRMGPEAVKLYVLDTLGVDSDAFWHDSLNACTLVWSERLDVMPELSELLLGQRLAGRAGLDDHWAFIKCIIFIGVSLASLWLVGLFRFS